MPKLKMYIETSVWNFLFADDAPEKKRVTQSFFDLKNIVKYDVFISEVVLAEIGEAHSEKREPLMEAIRRHEPEILFANSETRSVAEAYLHNGLLSQKHENDVLHLAFASVNGMDIILTWNMRHLVKRKTQLIVDGTNRMLGYRGLEIRTPWEMMEDDT